MRFYGVEDLGGVKAVFYIKLLKLSLDQWCSGCKTAKTVINLSLAMLIKCVLTKSVKNVRTVHNGPRTAVHHIQHF